MEEKVLEIFKQYKKDKCIVGVSGGPDSMCLLAILPHFTKKIIVAHINHGLRGKQSDEDEKFVRLQAKKYNFPCFVKRVKISKKSHIEEKGRDVRRKFFEYLLKKYKAKWIVTAHTQDDQLETIVFNFFRGSGIRGLAGMKVRNGHYLKPFLSISKKEILRYLKRHKIPYREDKTNKDIRFSRNLLRNKIFPLLQKINPSFKKTLLRNQRIFASLDNWIEGIAKNFLKKHQRGRIACLLKDYEKLDKALKSEVLQQAYKTFSKDPNRLSFVKVEEIKKMFQKRIGRKKIICGRRGMFTLHKSMIKFIKFS